MAIVNLTTSSKDPMCITVADVGAGGQAFATAFASVGGLVAFVAQRADRWPMPALDQAFFAAAHVGPSGQRLRTWHEPSFA